MKNSAALKNAGRFYLFLSVVALLSLLVSGGTFTHADEISLHVHATADIGDHGHATDCPACDVDDSPIHCGTNILITAMHEELAHPAVAPQTAIVRFKQLAGRMLVPEPPPPRFFLVFES